MMGMSVHSVRMRNQNKDMVSLCSRKLYGSGGGLSDFSVGEATLPIATSSNPATCVPSSFVLFSETTLLVSGLLSSLKVCCEAVLSLLLLLLPGAASSTLRLLVVMPCCCSEYIVVVVCLLTSPTSTNDYVYASGQLTQIDHFKASRGNFSEVAESHQTHHDNFDPSDSEESVAQHFHSQMSWTTQFFQLVFTCYGGTTSSMCRKSPASPAVLHAS